DGTSEPVYDREQLTNRAGTILARLSGEKFTAFAGSVSPVPDLPQVAVGRHFLELTADAAGLRIQVTDPSGAIDATDNIAAQQTPMVGDQQCMAKPKVTRAWFDEPRKRVLVELGWALTPPCVAPESQYRLFALR